MVEPRLPQLNVDITPEVKKKLGELGTDLGARKREIVGVLIKQASAKKISALALQRYRSELAQASRGLGGSDATEV
jgi:hypothetical protein